uniref:Dipeptidylpeptidase IV N-terminal domain-containing protein n=1 Tax=Parascaris univalens TaxID=6257 RepID=A0A915APL3_PARUN
MERNLRISEIDRLPLSDHRIIVEVDDTTSKQIIHNVERICVDPANNIVYCASRDRVFQFGAEHKVWVDWCAERGNRELMIFDFLYDDGKIFALFDNGRALLIDIIPKRIEVLEVVNDEVYGGSWAPDAHILVIASKESLYFVSREFEIISQEQLNPTSPGQCELMSVGWGSKQTQFQGIYIDKYKT